MSFDLHELGIQPQIVDMTPAIQGMNASVVVHGKDLHPVEEFIARVDRDNPGSGKDFVLTLYRVTPGAEPGRMGSTDLCTLRGHVGAGKLVGNEVRGIRPGGECVVTWDAPADGVENGEQVNLLAQIDYR